MRDGLLQGPTSLFVNHDAPAAERGRRVGIVGAAALIVVDDGRRVPDLDAELIDAPASVHVAVDRGYEETVAAHSVDRPRSLVLRQRPGDRQPRVGGRDELDPSGTELELRLTTRQGCTLRVFRNEPEGRFAACRLARHRQRAIAGLRIDPTASGYETAVR